MESWSVLNGRTISKEPFSRWNSFSCFALLSSSLPLPVRDSQIYFDGALCWRPACTFPAILPRSLWIMTHWTMSYCWAPMTQSGNHLRLNFAGFCFGHHNSYFWKEVLTCVQLCSLFLAISCRSASITAQITFLCLLIGSKERYKQRTPARKGLHNMTKFKM